eukprot:gene3092-4854_t
MAVEAVTRASYVEASAMAGFSFIAGLLAYSGPYGDDDVNRSLSIPPRMSQAEFILLRSLLRVKEWDTNAPPLWKSSRRWQHAPSAKDAARAAAAYSFTSKPIALALVNAKKRGVNVMVVADKKGNTAKYSAVTFLANEGVPVRLNGNYAIMHNKYIVIDGRDVETGSFNYTQAAAKSNAENALLLRGVPELAISYANNFNKLWAEADTLRPAY